MGVIVREKKKGSGEWWVFINHKGKRRSKKVGSKREANTVKREVEARLAKGDMGMLKHDCPTVASYGQKWLSSPIQEWADTTQSAYETIFELHIKPQLGSKKLDDIKRRDVKNLIASVSNLSPSRKQAVVSVLSGIFESAVDDEIVKANPCNKAGKYCGNGNLLDINPLTAEEVQTLLENTPIWAYPFFLMAVRTGLRVGELLALEWSDVDFQERSVEVNKTYNPNTRRTGLPKNKKSRKVDLSPATVKELLEKRKVVSISSKRLVFEDEKGKRLKYWNLQRLIKKVAPRPIRIHDLRHTYATLRIAKGDNILDVSKQLGHHKVSFTLDRYGHWLPGEHKAQVDALHLSAPYTHPRAVNASG